MTEADKDALELELRKLPGVSFVAFDEHDGMLVVQLLAPGVADAEELRERAAHLSRAHLDSPVTIEIDGGPPRAPVPGERVELLAVLPSPDGREIEVHLAYGGHRTVGRGPMGGGSAAAASATIDALRALRMHVPFSVSSAAAGLTGVAGGIGDAVVVVLASIPAGNHRFGVSSGATAHEAGARATLHALNRYLSLARTTEPA